MSVSKKGVSNLENSGLWFDASAPSGGFDLDGGIGEDGNPASEGDSAV